MKLREWQQVCLDAFTNVRNKQDRKTFVFEACPGAGKSQMAAELAWHMCNDEERPVDIVIVIVPWNSIRGDENAGVIKAFDRRGLQVRNKLMIRGARIVQQPVPTAYDAIVTTYSEAMTQEGVETIQLWKSKGLRIALIFDEIHHANEINGQWGSLAEDAHLASMMTVVMSGTFFRTDQKPIKFVKYDDDGNPILDCPPYKYARAVADRVCRPVAFRYVDVELKCVDEIEGLETVSLSSLSPNDRRFSKVMREVFHPEGDAVRHMILSIDEHLKRTRKRFRNAAALITCRPGRDDGSEDKHVKQIAQKVKQYTGQDVDVITHTDTNAQGKIDRFREGTTPYLVAVNMISEGVDIPRLRAVGFMKNISSEMMFRQIVGRMVRMIDGDEDGTAAMGFMPDFQLMRQFAMNMEGEALQGVKTWLCKDCGQYPCVCVCDVCKNDPCSCIKPGPGPTPPRPDFEIIESKIINAGGSVSQDQVNEALVTIARLVTERSPHHCHTNHIQLAHALSLAHPMMLSPDSGQQQADDTPLQKLNKARSRINRLINKLAGKVYGGDFKSCWTEELIRPYGVSWAVIKNTWTIQELDRLGNRLEERLTAAFKNGSK